MHKHKHSPINHPPWVALAAASYAPRNQRLNHIPVCSRCSPAVAPVSRTHICAAREGPDNQQTSTHYNASLIKVIDTLIVVFGQGSFKKSLYKLLHALLTNPNHSYKNFTNSTSTGNLTNFTHSHSYSFFWTLLWYFLTSLVVSSNTKLVNCITAVTED